MATRNVQASSLLFRLCQVRVMLAHRGILRFVAGSSRAMKRLLLLALLPATRPRQVQEHAVEHFPFFPFC